MQKINPCLWFDNQAEEAVHFYTSIFKNSKIGRITRNGEGSQSNQGGVLLVEFEIEGQPLTALNGGPHFKFSEAISLVVNCQSQQEVDEYWEKLLADGGTPQQCGWLKDKYGLSWQIVPTALMEMLNDPDAKKVQSVSQALLQMVKFDIAKLKQAYEAA
jgi:predicted 3-demethylubiquinone-9 3-methyltransferase (glyoxalase superfamily)